MGWNSYDAYGSSVTEAEFLANAQVLKEKLLSHGWNYVVVDFRWADETAANYDPNGIGGPLEMDANGRLLPAPGRFPSSKNGAGFKPLADKVHALGLKFGIHVMRGIPKQAVKANSPIEGSKFTAKEAANTSSTCSWCKDMWGVKGESEVGQAYYDSILRLYAGWGVDFIKVDDLVDIAKGATAPYHEAEVAALRAAIEKTGRPIVFSTSPGETPLSAAAHLEQNANQWRMSADFWDRWRNLNHSFDLAAKWASIGGPGRWPDGDMIPFGRIGIRCVEGDRQSRFTPDEQKTLLSLWALMPSPLFLGAALPDLDEATLARLTNDAVLAVNQDPLGKKGVRVAQEGKTEVWVKELSGGRKSVGLFNRGAKEATVAVNWSTLGLTGNRAVHDLWTHQPAGTTEKNFAAAVPSHGVILLEVAAP